MTYKPDLELAQRRVRHFANPNQPHFTHCDEVDLAIVLADVLRRVEKLEEKELPDA